MTQLRRLKRLSRVQFQMELAGTGLEKVVARSLRHLPAAEAAVSAWPVVCGSAVAERTRAESFDHGALRVIVPDAAWKRELQALAARYVAAMNRYVAERVERIEFVVEAGKMAGTPK